MFHNSHTFHFLLGLRLGDRSDFGLLISHLRGSCLSIRVAGILVVLLLLQFPLPPLLVLQLPLRDAPAMATWQLQRFHIRRVRHVWVLATLRGNFGSVIIVAIPAAEKSYMKN